MEATTLPPRELKNTMRRSLASELSDLRKSTNACGVSISITPSATITWGQRAPQPPVSSASTRKVIDPGSACEAAGKSQPQSASSKANRRSLGNGWWAVTGSNRRPSRCKRDALPAELTALVAQPFPRPRRLQARNLTNKADSKVSRAGLRKDSTGGGDGRTAPRRHPGRETARPTSLPTSCSGAPSAPRRA